MHGSAPPSERIVVAEAAALVHKPPRAAQVVLKQIAVGVVVDQIVVDVGQVSGPEQVAQLLVAALRDAGELHAAAQRQIGRRPRGEPRARLGGRGPRDSLLERIARRPARQTVGGDQGVPVDLRIARVGAAPRLLVGPVARPRGQVAVVVGHGRARVVPPQRAVSAHARLGAERHLERRGRPEGHAPPPHGRGHPLAPHARRAHPPPLQPPRGIVVGVTRQAEGLLHRREAHTPHR